MARIDGAVDCEFLDTTYLLQLSEIHPRSQVPHLTVLVFLELIIRHVFSWGLRRSLEIVLPPKTKKGKHYKFSFSPLSTANTPPFK